MKKVGILMGSDTDLPVVQKAIDVLRELEVPFEAHVMSAHRTPKAAAEFSEKALENGFGVLIGAAGMAAHLAGALACPCWVMLPHHKTDWRWLDDRTDSPWYPGVMRLYRQQAGEDWARVILEMARDLACLVEARCPPAIC